VKGKEAEGGLPYGRAGNCVVKDVATSIPRRMGHVPLTLCASLDASWFINAGSDSSEICSHSTSIAALAVTSLTALMTRHFPSDK
jgi:hypothetical protein